MSHHIVWYACYIRVSHLRLARREWSSGSHCCRTTCTAASRASRGATHLVFYNSRWTEESLLILPEGSAQRLELGLSLLQGRLRGRKSSLPRRRAPPLLVRRALGDGKSTVPGGDCLPQPLRLGTLLFAAYMPASNKSCATPTNHSPRSGRLPGRGPGGNCLSPRPAPAWTRGARYQH